MMITSDQGQQFESDLWYSLMNLLGATCPASQHTAHRQMVLWGGSTGTLKQAWKHIWQVETESMTSLLSVLEFMQSSRKTCHVHQQKWYMARPSICQETSPLPTWSRIPPPLCQDCGLQCSISSLFLQDGTAGTLFICLLISIQPPTYMCSVTAINLHLHTLTMVSSGFSAASTSTLSWTSMARPKQSQLTILKPAKLIGVPGTVELPAAVSAQPSLTLPARQENTSTPNQVPSHPPTTTQAGHLSCRPAHLADYIWPVGWGTGVTPNFPCMAFLERSCVIKWHLVLRGGI